MDNDTRRRWVSGDTALGGLLLLLGIAVLLGQVVGLELGQVGWPLFVIVPGLGMLGLGLATAGRLGEVLAMLGGVVAMVGLVLLVQNATDQFDTWAYAWTLVVLVGPGIGRWLIGAGLAAFLGLAVFFEVVVGIGGRPFGASSRYSLAALLILTGLLVLGRRLLAAKRL
jgi:hypothetical protein